MTKDTKRPIRIAAPIRGMGIVFDVVERKRETFSGHSESLPLYEIGTTGLGCEQIAAGLKQKRAMFRHNPLTSARTLQSVGSVRVQPVHRRLHSGIVEVLDGYVVFVELGVSHVHSDISQSVRSLRTERLALSNTERSLEALLITARCFESAVRWFRPFAAHRRVNGRPDKHVPLWGMDGRG